MELILASSSPRRKEILNNLGLSFRTIKPNDSAEPEVKSFSDAIIAARAKAYDVLEQLSPEEIKEQPIIVGSDTIVVLGEKVLGKPKDKDHAFKILKLLSGQRHIVATALSMITVYGNKKNQNEAFSSIAKTEIVFRDLSDEEILSYIDSGEPMDKAGAYAIQGRGGNFVETIVGCYTNVIGLPVPLFMDQLSQIKSQ